MKVIYEACDGTQFADELDCLDYEFKINLKWDKGIHFYNETEQMFSADVFDEYTYSNMFYVDIPTETDYKSFLEVAKYCGYCEYENITGPGYWKFIENRHSENTWEKIR